MNELITPAGDEHAQDHRRDREHVPIVVQFGIVFLWPRSSCDRVQSASDRRRV